MGIDHLTGKSLRTLILLALVCLFLISAGIFQSGEALIGTIPEELSPGSPISIILAVGEPVKKPDEPEDPLPLSGSVPAEASSTRFFTAGQLLPFSAVLLTDKNKKIQSAPFFYFDTIQHNGTVYTIGLAILVIPNTYEGNQLFYKVLKDTSATAAELPFAFLSGTQQQPLTVKNRLFETETIALGPENTDIKIKPDPRKNVEATELWKLLTTATAGLYTTGPFTVPVDSNRRTSYFGDRRLYQYANGTSERTIHGGIDFAVPRGTIVRATAPGLVQMARFRIVTGNTVVLRHAPGVYSLYYHMDSLSVKEGALVDTGTELGKSGSTGLSTGPHLHWEFRIQGDFADPDLMVTAAPLDKDRILGKILSLLGNSSTSVDKNADRSTEGR